MQATVYQTRHSSGTD